MFDVSKATTKELVAEYNRITGKSITKFSSRAAGEKQYAAAVKGGDAPPKAAAAPAAAAKKAARAPRAKAAPKPPADRSEAIRRSWISKDVHTARSARHGVQVHVAGDKGGTVETYRSTKAAFEALDLPLGIHIRFRMALKAAGKHQLEHDGVKYNFLIVEKTAD